jgi:cell division ATPase FtsA
VAEFAKKHLRLPSSIGQSQNTETVIDRVDGPEFATAVGLVLWGQKYGTGGGFNQSFSSILSHPGIDKAKRWLKSLLP